MERDRKWPFANIESDWSLFSPLNVATKYVYVVWEVENENVEWKNNNVKKIRDWSEK